MGADQTWLRGDKREPNTSTQTIKAEPSGETLPLQLQSAPPPKQTEDFQVLSVLGEGGMGRVELARQLALAREVALKRVRPERRSTHTEELLRREAIYTGSLEHPNIIPVHGLARDAQGGLVLVMKRVEGISWRALLQEETHPLFAGREPLVCHIEILLQVCTAIHFAHTKCIIHRDIKPENIMLGTFGEVYVADWGLARYMTEEMGKKPVGTPAYMAPEMTRGEATRASDIYLLGACLYEILMGIPPHEANSVEEALHFAATRAPMLSDELPRELVSICLRALHTSPSERFETAAQLRDELSAFLRHRGSLRLTQEAKQRLKEAETAKEEARKLLIESRFGLQQALKEWPQNEEALTCLQRCLSMMLRLELQEKNIRAAELLLSELSTPTQEQRDALTRLKQHTEEEERAKERLAKLEHEKDLNVAQRPKMFLSIGILLLSFAMISTLRYLRLHGLMTLSASSSLRVALIVLTIIAGTLFLGRGAFFSNQANRNFALSTLAIISLQVLHRVFNLFIDRPIEEAYASELFWLGALFCLLSLSLFWWLACFGALSMLASIVSLHYPSYAMEMMGFAMSSPFWALAFVWSQPNKRATRTYTS